MSTIPWSLLSTLLVVLVLASDADATTIYDNTTGSPTVGVSAPEGFQFGDQITLAGTDRIVTEFDFIVARADPDPTGAGPLGWVRFFANDGAGGDPGTLLYDSGLITFILGTNAVTGLSVAVPDTFTWTISIAQRFFYDPIVGLQMFDPPSIGSSDGGFFWVKLSPEVGSPPFFVKQNIPSGVPLNFGARVVAVSSPPSPRPIPEASSSLLFGVSSIALAVWLARALPRREPSTTVDRLRAPELSTSGLHNRS